LYIPEDDILRSDRRENFKPDMPSFFLNTPNFWLPLHNQGSFLSFPEELPHYKEETLNPRKACTSNHDKTVELSNKFFEVSVSHRVNTAHGPT
jgi:hypothetical protein